MVKSVVHVGKLKKRLSKVLSRSMNKQVVVKRINNLRQIEAPSKTFRVYRFTANYSSQDNPDKSLNLVLKRLRSDYDGTDFSNIHTHIHMGLEDPLEYTRNLFEYLQGPIINGNGEGALVRFYGSDYNDLFEEDAGDLSVEKLFLKDESNPVLLERLVEILADEHSRWDSRMGQKLDELRKVMKETNFSKKSLENLTALLRYHEKVLESKDKETLSNFFNGIESYFNHPDLGVYTGLCHFDMHLGHIRINNSQDEIDNALREMSIKNLDYKIIDVTGMSIGPQTFDLVDLLKHPLSVNFDVYPDSASQIKFISYLTELYRIRKGESELKRLNLEHRNGIEVDTENVDFQTLFCLSTVYRDVRAASKGILLKDRNEDLYNTYMKANKKYDLYAAWYIADLGETLRHLGNESFNHSFKDCLNQDLIMDTYQTIMKYLPGIVVNPIDVSKQIMQKDD